MVIRRDYPVRARRVGTGLNADEFPCCKQVYRVSACYDLIDRFVGAVGQEVAPDLWIDKANIEGIEAAWHVYLTSLYKSLLLRESRSVN
jgi:hypothetical protein